MCCRSIAGKIRTKDECHFFVEALCLGLPVIVAVPRKIVESVTDFGGESSILKLINSPESDRFLVYDRKMDISFTCDLQLIGSEPGVVPRIAPAWWLGSGRGAVTKSRVKAQLVPFPLDAPRTGLADFPHPALPNVFTPRVYETLGPTQSPCLTW